MEQRHPVFFCVVLILFVWFVAVCDGVVALLLYCFARFSFALLHRSFLGIVGMIRNLGVGVSVALYER